jgi:hypothetical protein
MRPASFRALYGLPHPRDATRCPDCGTVGGPSVAIFFVARLGAFAAMLLLGAPAVAMLRAPGAAPLGPLPFLGLFVALVLGFYIAHVLIASALNVLVSLVRQAVR